MAIPIKSIPALKGRAAIAFEEQAHINYTENKTTVDFSEQVSSANKILDKANKKLLFGQVPESVFEENKKIVIYLHHD